LSKSRLDKLLLELGLFTSRERVQSCIMTNGVKIAGRLVNKAGTKFDTLEFISNYETNPDFIQITDRFDPYVSRGAHKLAAAHKKFQINFRDTTVLDIGASTGGFVDFALQHGAKQVIALDVGKGQLHYKLQKDPRVVNLEETNFRFFDPDILTQISIIDIVLIDVSFISLIVILRRLKELSKQKKIFGKPLQILALLKPQFEAGKIIMDQCKGVIKDDEIREEVLRQSISKIQGLGYKIIGQIESPLKGAKGNIEYLLELL
jgi:23S rRNA (cytidine1920-2'-O)/16S rRNA (cytidine1409-2'-O)-methyltransferase